MYIFGWHETPWLFGTVYHSIESVNNGETVTETISLLHRRTEPRTSALAGWSLRSCCLPLKALSTVKTEVDERSRKSEAALHGSATSPVPHDSHTS